MSREHAREEASEFCLIFDTIQPPSGSRSVEKFEKAVSFAAGLAVHFAREGAKFEYLTPHDYIAPGIGNEHLYRILRSLAVVRREAAGTRAGLDPVRDFSGTLTREQAARIFSQKVLKIILTSRPRATLPTPVWQSSHVIYFDEL